MVVFKDQSETRRIDRMRADFIANASHELRTPLASITGFVEALRGPARNDAAARESFLKIMQEQTGRMARLIDDLLSLSRLEMKPFLPAGDRGRYPRDHRQRDRLARPARPRGRRRGGARVSGRPGHRRRQPRRAVPGVREPVWRTPANTASRAARWSFRSRREASAEGETSVTFRDFGPGIAAEHIPRITERFYRVDVDTSRGRKGTGLGLAIVKHILTRHNARLSIKSEVGKGSAFTVHFPARVRNLSVEAIGQDFLFFVIPSA